MNWGLKNSADRGRHSKNREWHEPGVEVGMSKDYLGVREQLILAIRFEEWVGTSFGIALSIRLIGPAFILWTIKNE